MAGIPAEPRRAVPMKLQRDLALQLVADLMRKLGMVPVDVSVEFELDHTPALCLREVDPATGQHIPHQHDPSCLIWRTKEAHKVKTHGPGGEKRITTAGSDQHAWRKSDRLAETEAATERRRLAARAAVEVAEQTAVYEAPKRKWGGAGFRPAKPQRRASGYVRKGV